MTTPSFQSNAYQASAFQIYDRVVTLAASEAADTCAISANVDLAAFQWGAFQRTAFQSRQNIDCSLSATEASDTVSISANLNDFLVLAVTDTPDTASGIADLSTGLILAATEAKDIAAGLIEANAALSLAATEASDTASLVAARDDSVPFLNIYAQEAADVSTITLAVETSIQVAATGDRKSVV